MRNYLAGAAEIREPQVGPVFEIGDSFAVTRLVRFWDTFVRRGDHANTSGSQVTEADTADRQIGLRALSTSRLAQWMEACCLECAVASNRAGDLIWGVAMAAGFGLNFKQTKPARVLPARWLHRLLLLLVGEGQRMVVDRRWALNYASLPRSSRSCNVKLHSRSKCATRRIPRCSSLPGAISGPTLRINRQEILGGSPLPRRAEFALQGICFRRGALGRWRRRSKRRRRL
jgi:hypothetical protein